MLRALDLSPQPKDPQEELNNSYAASGLQRQQSLFALKCNGGLVALFMVMRTELGLNLSNLINAITVLVINPQAIPREAFFTAISMLATKYPEQEVPVLTYPSSYASLQAIEIEKHYNLWVLDCEDLDPYFEFCDTYFLRLRRNKDKLT